MSQASFDEDFQATTVAYFWRVPGVLQKYLDKVQASYFDDATTATVYLHLVNHFKEYKKCPAMAVLMESIRMAYPDGDSETHTRTRKTIRKKLEEMMELDISDAKFIEDSLKKFVQYNSLKAFALETVNSLETRRYDPDLAKKARIAMDAGIIDDDLGHDWQKQTTQRILHATAPDHEPRIATGVTHLDKLIGGGLKAGELGIILGLPKGFKSGTLLNFAHSAMKVSQGLHVVYVTLELSEDLVGLRFDFRCAGMTKEQLMADPERFTNVLRQRMDIMMGGRLFVKNFRTKTCTCDTVRNYLDRLQEVYGIKIGMLIVDYLDLMKPTRKREKSYLEDVEICEDLRDIAIEYRIPVWTACRATRDAVGRKRMSMAHMSRAFERVGVADLMLALCQTEKEKAEKVIRLYLAAARNDEGEKMVHCKVDYPRMLLISQSISDPEYEDDTSSNEGFKGKKKKPKSESVDWDAESPQ